MKELLKKYHILMIYRFVILPIIIVLSIVFLVVSANYYSNYIYTTTLHNKSYYFASIIIYSIILSISIVAFIIPFILKFYKNNTNSDLKTDDLVKDTIRQTTPIKTETRRVIRTNKTQKYQVKTNYKKKK